ncbi:ATP-dependent protease [candidate division GN15 bacterium]|uniref:endopeptidase La n=1 Tax=candidate division GN15 bacterium TaxID=2072418 RepID=A0A855WZQ4_9BACT|nr:MAG: ATP-dependent protease [candidate division GN15 bacterium]
MMTARRPKKSKSSRELTLKEISYQIDFHPRGVRTSDDIAPCEEIIGQARAIEAIKVGLHIKSRGYNIFVTGMSGTGRTTTIQHLLQQLDHHQPQLNDICYVNNFKNEDNPRVLVFEAGDGKRFKKDMAYLVASLRKVVPKIFLSEDYKERQSRIVREFENRQKELVGKFEEKLDTASFVMVQIQAGLAVRNEIQPLVDGEPAPMEKLERMVKDGKFPTARLDELHAQWEVLRREFDATSLESKKLTTKMEDAIEKLNLSMVAPLVTEKINLLRKRYPLAKAIEYLNEVEEALSQDLDRYREAQPRRGEEEAPPYRKREPFEEFSVNLILDNAGTTKVPIIIENSPSYKNLFGSLERVVDRFGYWRTDFTRIYSGSLLRAAGGFLVVNALDLLNEPGVWWPLKRALRNGEIEITGFDPFYMMAGSGIKPEPVPCSVKVVLIGEPHLYNLLWRADDDFKKVFRIKAEFDSVMPLNNENLKEYFCFVRRRVTDEGLLPFDVSGMQGIAEYGRRLAGHRNRLSVRFTAIADMVREANFCALEHTAKRVTRADVHAAILKKRQRVNLVEEKVQEMFDSDVLLVSTKGSAVGQVNGLSVYDLGEYSFGRPTRITVNTSLGKAGVINIEREADLSGPIHDKGVLVLSGFLRLMFAQDKPLEMSASISFEQSYSGVDGDSASSTEIYGILSSLTGLPIKQGIAVTGSVNQKGEIQPIGGINEKIEGFYDVCMAKGLTGDQGVILPRQNVQDLIIRPDVVEAIGKKRFHLYPVDTISDGISVLTGVPGGKRLPSGSFTPGSVLALADQKLRTMALTLENWTRQEKKNNNDANGRKKEKKRTPRAT